MKTKISKIGKTGIQTSYRISKTLAKKLLKGGSGACQDEIYKEIDNPNSPWIQLVETFQNIQGKGIATLLGRIQQKEVIIKVQYADSAKNELEMNNVLKINETEGFIHFECFATCEGDKKYIESFGVFNEKSRLCKAKGVSMGIIIMPYYENGSFENFLKTYSNIDKLEKVKSIMKTVIKNYFNAYQKLSFTHGDFFSKNVVLDKDFNPVIIDFELAEVSQANKLTRFWIDIEDLFNDLIRYTKWYQLDDIIRQHIWMNRAMSKEPDRLWLKGLTKGVDEVSVVNY